MRVVFMGTPDFAVGCLAAICGSKHQVVATVTVADKPTGRGLQVSESAVKKYAISKDIPVLQPEKLRDPTFIEELRAYKADVFVVVAFRMLPELVWAMPPLGTINLHASVLPQYRGAAPINWAIINGDKTTGVSTFFIEKEIDSGKIIEVDTLEIGPDETAGDLHDRLLEMGSQLMVKTLDQVETASYTARDQIFTENLKPAPKIFKETCQISFNKKSQEIHNFVRGLSPYPAAWTILADKQMKIFRTALVPENQSDLRDLDKINTSHYTIYSDHKKKLYVGTEDGFIEILSLQLEGKKRMSTEDFLRGYRF
jgi:methionyl-tRNA formyltransferase